MIKHLIHRPISVFMAFTALFILGIITYMNIPVSLLPDIAIPEITVQISGKNTSARELENTVVTPVRQQLLQVAKLRDIRSETRDGSAIIHLSFEYGANTDLSFIEVNVEALAGWESSGQSSIKGDCTSSYVIITDCYVNCPSCYTNWYTTPIIRNQKSYNISGSCSCAINPNVWI